MNREYRLRKISSPRSPRKGFEDREKEEKRKASFQRRKVDKVGPARPFVIVLKSDKRHDALAICPNGGKSVASRKATDLRSRPTLESIAPQALYPQCTYEYDLEHKA